MTLRRNENPDFKNGSAPPRNGPQDNKGPKAGKFNSSEAKDGKKKFKDGNFTGEPLEKKRYQHITVTALGNLTVGSRILQSADSFTMNLEVGAEDVSGCAKLFFSASIIVVVSLFSLFL